MAYEESLVNVTLEAAADLSAKQYFGVEVNTSGQAALAGNGEDIIGVLQNKPDAAGEPATIAISGITKASAGGTIAAGDSVGLDANGEFVSAATGDACVGVALESAVDGDIFPLLIAPLARAFA